jgi:hypothetical protein
VDAKLHEWFLVKLDETSGDERRLKFSPIAQLYRMAKAESILPSQDFKSTKFVKSCPYLQPSVRKIELFPHDDTGQDDLLSATTAPRNIPRLTAQQALRLIHDLDLITPLPPQSQKDVDHLWNGFTEEIPDEFESSTS